MILLRFALVLAVTLAAAAPAEAATLHARSPDKGEGERGVERAQYLWSRSPQGRMLERILPRSIEPRDLPEPRSEGARLTARYCVQCHHLPSPEMHTPDKWNGVVVRMVWRMQGKGNLGHLMKDMMEHVEAPGEQEVATLTGYLQKHGQQEMDPSHPALRSEPGKMYSLACTQCHSLPDPGRHTAREWPGVVERMRRHMASYNTVVGADAQNSQPVLDTKAIVRFLQRHARDAAK